ncbi:MAG: hypothetical protein N3B18_13135 [Desulfobacterota bacterium]|nr:hypothetical protein [Thermodesulfobacteriota bacterium]
MADNRSPLEALLVAGAVIACAVGAAWYLTFVFPRQAAQAPIEKSPVRAGAASMLHRPFHYNTPDKNLEAWSERSACIICHSASPHGKDRQVMAVINLHTEFLTCDCCHLKNEHHEKVRFGWVRPPGITVSGKPYGTTIDPSTGLFAQTDDHYSLIAPLHEVNGRWEPFLSFASEKAVALARSYRERKERLSADERTQLVQEAHQGTELKEFVRCSQCHSYKGIMDFYGLGFDQTRAHQLEKLEVSGMLTNYEVFYFPELFEKKFK